MDEGMDEWMKFLSEWQTAGCLVRHKMRPYSSVLYSTVHTCSTS